ncbi:MAG: oligosaccharide flippase family protein [Carbonactinosporaceae bacterium]
MTGRFTRNVTWTAICNVAMAAVAAGAGVIVARSAGPHVRGEYAAVMVWFGAVLVVGQLGQTAATTFFVARDPQRAPDYLATSRNMMVTSGGITLALGCLAAPLLAHGDATLTWGFRLMFATSLVSFVGASYTFSLQATSVSWWNLARVSQPVLYVAALLALHLTGRLGLITALGALSVTIVVQTVLAYRICGMRRLTGGRAERTLVRPMTRYGLSQLASVAPSLSGRLDLLVLSLAVAPAALGRYAVAVSMTTLAVPIVSALGNVAFPLIASRVVSGDRAARLGRAAMLASIGLGAVLVIPLALLAPWVVPRVFGPGFREAVPLIWLLAPGGVLFGSRRVCGDLLRGYGRPRAVAWAEATGATVTVLLMATLLPAFGIAGAAVASSAAAAVTLLVMVTTLRRLSREGTASTPATGGGVPPPVVSERP